MRMRMGERNQVVRVSGCKLRDIETNKIYEFERLRDADDFLGRGHGSTTRHIREDRIIKNDVGKEYEIIPGEVKKIKIQVTERPLQLCWNCQKAVCGCSWSRNFAPVPGWTATKTEFSYHIKECPEFVADRKRG